MYVKFAIPGGEHFSMKHVIWSGEIPDAVLLPVGATFAIKRGSDTGYFLISYMAMEMEDDFPCLVYYISPKLPTKEAETKKLLLES